MILKRSMLGLFMGLTLSAIPAQASEPLTVVTEIGPWPVVSRMIGYGDRLWFANSIKGRNHNSADLYSYSLKTSDVRYERHLFSQDAGRPVVFDGLLHWPLEDARFSFGYGQVVTTDGEHWTENVIPTGRIFHTHALAATDHLIAATSAWRAHIDLSMDGGNSWRQVYDHPTPDRRVSRIVDLVAVGQRVFGSLVSRDEQGLLEVSGPVVQPVPGWPFNRTIRALTVHQGHVYGLVQMAEGVEVWRSDGESSEQVTSLKNIGNVGTARDLIADERGFWLLATGETGGSVWQSEDGKSWTQAYDFSGGVGFELASYRGRLFVGGSDQQRETGLLWGSANDPVSDLANQTAKATTGLNASSKSDANVDWTAKGTELDRLLMEAATYQNRARILRDLVLDLSNKNPPPGFFASRLVSPMPDEPMSLIGGAVQIPSALMGRALLLFGIALQGEGALSEAEQIPLDLLKEPWTREPNRAEKYFDTLPFALSAIGSAKQNDRATIDTLVSRLANEEDPLWVKGDVIGALTAITDQRYAYDVEAWRSWWANAMATWTPQ